jgi:hypothetical protein
MFFKFLNAHRVILCAFFVTFFSVIRIISINFKNITMKKILIITILSMLSVVASAQMKLWFNKIAETEINPNYVAGCNTMEGYIQGFIEKFDTIEFNNVLRAMEAGTIGKYMEDLRDLGEKQFVEEADYIKSMLWNIVKSKLYFIDNAKLYVITYDIADYKSLYLYRRDADGWKIASDLIREDDYQFGEYMRRFESRTTRWNENDTLYTLENQFFGEVHRISNGSVFVTFSTEIWYPQAKGYTYNSIAVFVPDTIVKETYHVSLFEPENKVGKVLKNVTNHNYNWSKRTWSKSLVTTIFPVLSGIRNTEYIETPNGLTIRYWDGTEDNPIDAGSVNFNVVSSYVGDYPHIAFGSETIVLNQVK